MIETTAKVEYESSSGKLWVYNSRLANQLNKVLKHYDGGNYFFLIGEEAVFIVPQILLNEVTSIINRFK